MFFQKTSLQIGYEMENLACHYLEQQGLQLLLRNYRCKMGEIDLIMRDNQLIIFVEVKYRRQTRFGSSLEAIDMQKRAKLVRTAEYYLLRNRINSTCQIRFDAITIEHVDHQRKIHWIKNIIELEQ